MATVTGSGSDDTLIGTANADTITGGIGDDVVFGGGGNDSIVGDGLGSDPAAITYVVPPAGVFSYATGANLGDGAPGGTNHLANVASNSVFGLQLTFFDGNTNLTAGETISFSFIDENGDQIFVENATIQQTAFANPGIEGTGVLTAQGIDQNGEPTAILLKFNENDGSPPTPINAGNAFFDNDTDPNAFNGTDVTVPLADTQPATFNDNLNGGAGSDTIIGGLGNDTISGGSENDSITGDEGNDVIDGGSGNDTIDGGADNDLIVGNAGDDSIIGGGGNDTIQGDAGANEAVLTRQSFEWDELTAAGGGPIANGGTITSGSVQNTGLVNVTVSNTPGPQFTGFTYVANSTQAVGGINTGAEIIDTTSAGRLAGTGLGQTSTAEISFASAAANVQSEVQNVQFRVNDIDDDDWRDLVTIRAFNAAGESVPVTLSVGSALNLTNSDSVPGGDTVSIDNGGGNSNSANANFSVLVNIAGPVARFEVSYSNLEAGPQIVDITDIFFDAVTVTQNTVVGNDNISGGDGVDQLFGQGGNDTLDGGNDGDLLDGGTGNDSIIGGEGNDFVFGGAGIDTVDGGIGNDFIDGGTERDILNGGEGNDTIFGQAGNDIIDGGAGNDNIDGGSGNDTILGGADNDTINGGIGNDAIDGGTGDDSILGGTGSDAIFGGDGQDSIQGEAGADIIFGGAGLDTIDGGSGADNIDGGADNDSILGGADNDTIQGGTGNDTIDGGTGADSVLGGADDDSLIGGEGNDTLDGQTENDSISGGTGDDSLAGGAGTDTLDGGADNDTVFGGADADTILASTGTDDVHGGDGIDTYTVPGASTIANDTETITVTVDENGNGTVVKTVDATTDTIGSVENFIADEAAAENDSLIYSTVITDEGTITGLAGSTGTFTSNNGVVTTFGGVGEPTFNDVLAQTLGGTFVANGGNLTGTVGNIAFTDFETLTFSVVCFTRDTMIATEKGSVAIQALRAGDMVRTADHGFQPVRWIGSRSFDAKALAANPHLRPITLPAGSFGNDRDLTISPQHRMLVRSVRNDLLFGTPEVLIKAKDLLGRPGVRVSEQTEVEYFHILFDDHEIVFANGAASESLHPGIEALDTLSAESRAEVLAIFPELAAKDFSDRNLARYALRSYEARALAA